MELISCRLDKCLGCHRIVIVMWMKDNCIIESGIIYNRFSEISAGLMLGSYICERFMQGILTPFGIYFEEKMNDLPDDGMMM